MRAMLMVVVGLAVCFTLSGCDRNQQAQTVTAMPAVVAPPPPCKCQQAATAPRITIAHRYRRRAHHHGHTLDEFLAYSTNSSESTSESHTVREYRPGDEDSYSETERAEMRDTVVENHREAGADAHVWVDGYGKEHYADYGPLDDEHPGLISRKDARERMRPWRGYDSNCDNRID